MKMEVLSAQNQFQNQFGVLGSSKVNDWMSPLTPPPSQTNSHHHHHHNHNHTEVEPATVALTSSPHEDALQALSLRIQNELRTAKTRHLACTEVLLPADLLHRVASQMFIKAEKEPCGIRGCTVYIEFEDTPGNTRRIASFKPDPTTVSTFELYLTLKHDRSGWTSILPQFLKNLARGSTIMISPEFNLIKHKLYRCFTY